MSVLFVTDHHGPLSTLKPLARRVAGCVLVSCADLKVGTIPESSTPKSLIDEAFLNFDIHRVVRGCSDKVDRVPSMEDYAAERGRGIGISVAAIEDFPGNYINALRAPIDTIYLDGFQEAPLCESVDLQSLGNPRYDQLHPLSDNEIRHCRLELGLDSLRPIALWAGQPNKERSYHTFCELLPHLRELQAQVLFRAHPRDCLYSSGQYLSVLTEYSDVVMDVSTYPDILELLGAADLTITQFSSVAVQGLHMGTPALFVLFPEMGGTDLNTLKGCQSLVWPRAGAAFQLSDSSRTVEVLRSALFDRVQRTRVLSTFRRLFQFEKSATDQILLHMKEF